MELHSIRGGNKEDLEAKKYNIAVGISLGNKWFTTQNIVGQTKWALAYTREYVVVYVADSIHAINIEVRNRVSSHRALTIALNKGAKILEDAQAALVKELSSTDFARVHFARWEELETKEYESKTHYLYTLYAENDSFRSKIHSIVRSYTTKEEKKFNDDEIHRLGMYIIEELPELICRCPIRGLMYDANAYPTDGEVLKLVEEIQLGKIFPEIKKKILTTEPKVFLEVR
jgi:tRNA-dependent cyclodipeptide synthase